MSVIFSQFSFCESFSTFSSRLTAAAAAFDFLRALPEGARALLHLDPAVALAEARLPLFAQGFGWVCPAALGFAVGLAMRSLRRRRQAA